MKIILAGSPQIAVDTFEQVIKNFDVVAIITQPDKPKGRGMKLSSTPVYELAKKYNIQVFKSEKIIKILEELKQIDFDLLLTFAFGQWIPESILNLGKFKPLNIHGSLLPKYRGAAPIQHAILNGEKKIGITLIEMTKEMDAGDMYFQAEEEIDWNTTTGDAFSIISRLAKDNIVSWLYKIQDNNVSPIKQNNDFTLSPKIEKSFAELNEILSIYETIRKIKALNPFPGAFKIINNKRVKIFNASITKIDGAIQIKCSDGVLYANDYQYENKKRIKIL